MTQLLSQVSESVAMLVAGAAPLLTAVRIGQNRQVTGFLWRDDLVVTTDQALPAATSYTIVLSSGALISARPGPRDPVRNLAALWLDGSVPVTLPELATGTAVGALVLALGTDFDGSPTVRLTTVHSFPRTPGAGADGAMITLDLTGARVSPGGMVLDAAGRLLGMASVSPGAATAGAAAGDAIVVPNGAIARFVEVVTTGVAPVPGQPAAIQPMPPPMVQPIPQVAVSTHGNEISRGGGSRDGTSRNGHAGNGRRGWLGVSLQPITVPESLVHRAGQPTARQVVGVTRGGPADRAGLRAGDVLLALDGASTSGNHALRAFLAPERIGTEVEVRMMRDGQVHTTVLTVAAQPG
jgi:S1-C subfamily serine protease